MTTKMTISVGDKDIFTSDVIKILMTFISSYDIEKYDIRDRVRIAINDKDNIKYHSNVVIQIRMEDDNTIVFGVYENDEPESKTRFRKVGMLGSSTLRLDESLVKVFEDTVSLAKMLAGYIMARVDTNKSYIVTFYLDEYHDEKLRYSDYVIDTSIKYPLKYLMDEIMFNLHHEYPVDSKVNFGITVNALDEEYCKTASYHANFYGLYVDRQYCIMIQYNTMDKQTYELKENTEVCMNDYEVADFFYHFVNFLGTLKSKLYIPELDKLTYRVLSREY